MGDDILDFVGDGDEPDTAIRLHDAIAQARALDITDDHRISVPVGELSGVLDELMELRKARTKVSDVVTELHARGDECRCQSALSQLVGLTRYGADCAKEDENRD